MRSTSLWAIAILGIAAFAVVSFFMMFMLDQFSGTPAGSRTALANEVRNRFRFDDAAADLSQSGKRKILRLEYKTIRDRAADDETAEREMQDVARFVLERTAEGKDPIEEVRVSRRELYGSGCSQKTRLSSFHLEREEPKQKNPYDLGD